MRTFIALLILAPTLHASPLAGAWETFATLANTNAWSLYSYDDGLAAPPLWVAPETDANPYAYSYFIGGKGVWFFADEFTARGAFVGNYAAQKISGIDVSVNIDPAEIDFIDLAVYADGPNGLGYYYSSIYSSEDLGQLPDWYSLSFNFGKIWFALKDGNYTSFKPNSKFLKSIQEIGVRVFPLPGVTGNSFVGVDDIILVPSLEAPKLTTSLNGGNFVLGFTPNPGLSATIEKLTPTLTWQTVVGQSGLTGPQNYTTPVVSGSGLFRVAAKEKLTPVTSP